jgi:hypothetical protein
MELASVICGDGLDPLSFVPEQIDRAGESLVFGRPSDLTDSHDARSPFHYRDQARLAL